MHPDDLPSTPGELRARVARLCGATGRHELDVLAILAEHAEGLAGRPAGVRAVDRCTRALALIDEEIGRRRWRP
jgi:hypothetical protein